MRECEAAETSRTPHLCAASFALLLLLLVQGCGAPAAPQPPTLNLPQPLRSLTAERVGDRVRLSFDLPEKTTDRLPIVGAIRAQVCRTVAAAPCQAVLTVPLALQQKTAEIEDPLPAALAQGPVQLLTYRVDILNSAGRAAPDAVVAYAAAGSGPAPVQGFAVVPQGAGVVLRWQSINSPVPTFVRFDRVRAGAPEAPSSDRTTVPESPEQKLEVREGVSAAALDRTVHFGSSYRYTAQRFTTVTLAEHTLEMFTAPTPAILIDYKDVFPPPVPSGLVSAVDTPAHAIDLSWSAEADPGLAGYIVYRRSESGTPARISPAGKPVPTPSWRDDTGTPGARYFYSVSAVDQAGNESARSAEIEEQLQP